jgi:cytochrome c peroxidase
MNSMKYMCVAAAVVASVAVSAAAPITVSQQGLQFSVGDLAVAKGQMVVFKNDDRTAHNITVNGAGVNLNSGLQQPGVEFKVPFAKPGTYQVSCGIHPKMKLTVTVQ